MENTLLFDDIFCGYNNNIKVISVHEKKGDP